MIEDFLFDLFSIARFGCVVLGLIATLATSKRILKNTLSRRYCAREVRTPDLAPVINVAASAASAAAASATAMRTHAINFSSFLFSVFPAHNFKTPALLGRRPLGTHLTFIAS